LPVAVLADGPPEETPSHPDGKLLVLPDPAGLTDPIESLSPRTERSESQADRLHATALFATARLLEQSGRETAALRRYQRAYRYDPAATGLLDRIIPLAFKLGRFDEAVRYALIAMDRKAVPTGRIREMARHLAEQGDYAQAISLYEKVLPPEPPGKRGLRSIVFHLELGRVYFLAGQFNHAVRSLAIVEEALVDPAQFNISADSHQTLLGENGLTHHLIGEAYLAADRLDAAEAAYRKAHAGPQRAGLLGYHLARIEQKRGHPQAALDHLQKYFAAGLSGERDAPYRMLVELYGRLDRSGATERLQQLYAQDAENDRLGLFLADRYRAQKQWQPAQKIYRRIASAGRQSQRLSALQGLIAVAHQKKQTAELLDLLSEVVELVGGLRLIEDDLKMLVEDRQQVQALVAAANQRAQQGKLGSSGTLAMAQFTLLAEQFEPAQTFFREMIAEDHPNPAALYEQWGLGLFRAEQFSPAAGVFREALQKEWKQQQRAAFLYYLAGALELDGKTDQALAAAREAAGLQPDSIRFAQRIGWIEYHAGRSAAASKTFAELIQRFDDQHDSAATRKTLRQVRLLLSNLAAGQNDIAAAERWLEEVLDEFPGDVNAANDLGYLWADQGKHLQRALRMIETALAAEPENAAYLDSLGWALYQLGRYEEALPHLEKAASAEPAGVILRHLADLYMKLGRREEAIAHYRRALEAFEVKGQADEAALVRNKLESIDR